MQRVEAAIHHPSRWLAGLTGGGPVYALWILFGLNMTSQMDATGFSILIPNIRDAFHMTNAGILSLVAAAAVVGLALQVPIAQMADRRNRVHLMLLGAGVFAAFVFGTGLAISVWMLAVMRSGTGVGQATVGPTHNSLIADWYPINSRPGSTPSTSAPTPSAPSSGRSWPASWRPGWAGGPRSSSSRSRW